MEILIESTPVVRVINGARCRVWKGHTAEGVECEVFVLGIGVAEHQDQAAFEEMLASIPPPAPRARRSYHSG